MSQIEIAILTAGVTLLGGSILYIIQHWLEDFFWIPIMRQKETIEGIATALINYANIYSYPEIAKSNYINGGPLKEKVNETTNQLLSWHLYCAFAQIILSGIHSLQKYVSFQLLKKILIKRFIFSLPYLMQLWILLLIETLQSPI